MQEVSSHRNAVAKEPPRPLIGLAKSTASFVAQRLLERADSAYQQALSDINFLQALVEEVEESYFTSVDRL